MTTTSPSSPPAAPVLRHARAALSVPSRAVLVAPLVALGPVLVAAVVRDDYALSGPYDLFTLTMSVGGLGLVLALVAAAVYAWPLSRELSQRYVPSARTRMPVRAYVWWRVAAAAVVGFGVLFAAALVPFLWAFVLDPAFGDPVYEQTSVGLSPQEAADLPATQHTFSQLLALGPWAYGLGFSLWLGLNGALYAVLGVLLVLSVPNRFVALAAPFVATNAIAFVMAIAGVPQFSPVALYLNLIQFPMWVPFVPLGATAVVVALLAVWVHRSVPTNERLM